MSKTTAQATCPHCRCLVLVDCLVTDDYGNAEDRCSNCGRAIAFKVEYIRVAKATDVRKIIE